MGWVLFFDGECGFCSASVRRAAKWDRRQRLKFSPLQGKMAAELGVSEHAGKDQGTLVLLREEDGKVFKRSDALVELTRVLGGWWRVLTPVRFLPRVIRDGVYQWVADHRRWFSRKGDFCSLGDPEVEKRLID